MGGKKGRKQGEESSYAYNALGARIEHQEVRENLNAGHQDGPFVPGSRNDGNPLSQILKDGRAFNQRIWETTLGTVKQTNPEAVKKEYVEDYTSQVPRDIFVVEQGSFEQSYVYANDLTPEYMSLNYTAGTTRGGIDSNGVENPGTNPGSDIAATETKEMWHHGNLLASSVFLTDGAGQIKTHMIYDEWGRPERETRYDMNYHGLGSVNNYTGAQFRGTNPL